MSERRIIEAEFVERDEAPELREFDRLAAKGRKLVNATGRAARSFGGLLETFADVFDLDVEERDIPPRGPRR